MCFYPKNSGSLRGGGGAYIYIYTCINRYSLFGMRFRGMLLEHERNSGLGMEALVTAYAHEKDSSCISNGLHPDKYKYIYICVYAAL